MLFRSPAAGHVHVGELERGVQVVALEGGHGAAKAERQEQVAVDVLVDGVVLEAVLGGGAGGADVQ